MDSKTKNGLIVLGVVVVLGVVAMKFMKMKQQPPSGGDGTNGGGGGGNSGGGNSGGGNSGGGGQQSLSYRSLADALFEAMDGYGTNEDDIMGVFKNLRNQADFDALEQAYGSREVSSGRGNIFQSNYKGRLVGALKEELGSSDLADLNSLLRSKKIKAI